MAMVCVLRPQRGGLKALVRSHAICRDVLTVSASVRVPGDPAPPPIAPAAARHASRRAVRHPIAPTSARERGAWPRPCARWLENCPLRGNSGTRSSPTVMRRVRAASSGPGRRSRGPRRASPCGAPPPPLPEAGPGRSRHHDAHHWPPTNPGWQASRPAGRLPHGGDAPSAAFGWGARSPGPAAAAGSWRPAAR